MCGKNLINKLMGGIRRIAVSDFFDLKTILQGFDI